MNNPKDCIHCYDYEDMGCKMPVCEFDFPSIDTPKCNDCSKFTKRDLVQVVRCRDCRYYHVYWENNGHTEKGYGACDWINDNSVREDHFCSWGERREDDSK